MHYNDAENLESYFFRYSVLEGRNRSHKHILINPSMPTAAHYTEL